MSNYRQLVEDAAAAVQMYRHPDISECHDALDGIITAAKLGGISHDRLVYIGIDRGVVRIRTEYTIRGCDQADDYEFPAFLLDADDPVAAASLWGAEQRASIARSEVEEARRILASRESNLKKAEEEAMRVANASTPPRAAADEE